MGSDLLVRSSNLGFDLAVPLILAAPLIGQFHQAGIEVLPFPLGIGDIGILVPEPALGLLDLLPFLLHLLGEGGDVGVVQPFLDLIELGIQDIDLGGDIIQLHLKSGKFCSTVPGLFRLPGNGRFYGLFLNRNRVETA